MEGTADPMLVPSFCNPDGWRIWSGGCGVEGMGWRVWGGGYGVESLEMDLHVNSDVHIPGQTADMGMYFTEEGKRDMTEREHKEEHCVIW